MSNSELLKGKEYLDFILDFLQGKKDEIPHNEKRYCYHELTKEESRKILDSLKDPDMIYYFNCKDGFKTLIDSLDMNEEAISIL